MKGVLLLVHKTILDPEICQTAYIKWGKDWLWLNCASGVLHRDFPHCGSLVLQNRDLSESATAPIAPATANGVHTALSQPMYLSLADYLANIYSSWINEWVFKLSPLWLALVTSIHKKGRLWLTGGKNTLDNTEDSSGKRPNQVLGSSKKPHKINKWKTCFSFSKSGDLNVLHFSVIKGPICSWLSKREYYFVCVLPTADKYFCRWTFKEKHVFLSLPAFYFLALHNCRTESDQWGRWG